MSYPPNLNIREPRELVARQVTRLMPGDVLNTNGATVLAVKHYPKADAVVATLRTTSGAIVTPTWKDEIWQTVWRLKQ